MHHTRSPFLIVNVNLSACWSDLTLSKTYSKGAERKFTRNLAREAEKSCNALMFDSIICFFWASCSGVGFLNSKLEQMGLLQGNLVNKEILLRFVTFFGVNYQKIKVLLLLGMG